MKRKLEESNQEPTPQQEKETSIQTSISTTTNDTTSNNDDDDDHEQDQCPLYGSQEYWDKRYKKNYYSSSCLDDVNQVNEDKEGGRGDAGDDISDEASPGFSWYFTYQDLKPLLLPLVLGSNRHDDDEDDEEEEMEEEGELEEDNGEEEEDEEEEEEEEEEDGKSVSVAENEDCSQQIEHEKDETLQHQTTDSITNAKEEDLLPSDTEEDTMEYQIDISLLPRKVLEIGCGDVPLGEELCKDILKLGEKHDVDARKIVSSIICFDYIQCCIDVLREKQEQQYETLAFHNNSNNNNNNNNNKDGDRLKVEYKVHDARYLPYKDHEFHVIIDKGTLDAVLSDKIQGKNNCMKILSEASRILAVDGYILIVSHLNANEPHGMSWLHEVLIPGLTSGCSTYQWKIEVHGNDVSSSDQDTDDATIKKEEKSKQAGSSKCGPAVYIIQKRIPLHDEKSNNNNNNNNNNIAHDNDEETFHSLVDVQFFGY